jgi:hypothetical protein
VDASAAPRDRIEAARRLARESQLDRVPGAMASLALLFRCFVLITDRHKAYEISSKYKTCGGCKIDPATADPVLDRYFSDHTFFHARC